jgi:site-specific recombinase XerD
MVALARVLRDVYAPPPTGCRSDHVKRLFRDFFTSKTPVGVTNIWCKYRYYAHFMKKKRDSWPGAIEALMEMKKEDALQRVDAFKAWVRATGRSNNVKKAGHERPFMFTLFRFAKARGIVSWDYPNSGEILERKSWARVRPEFRDDAREWGNYLRRLNHQPSSVTSRLSTLRYFGAWLKACRLSHLKVQDIIAQDWMDWVMSQERFGDGYRQSMLSTARSFYRWLRMRRDVRENPFDGMGRIKVKQTLPRVCTEREVLKLIRAAETPLERAIIEILYATGCRVSEVCGMELPNLSMQARHAKILGKWRRERMVLLNGAACRAIRAYLPTRATILRTTSRPDQIKLFVNTVGSELEPRAIQVIIRKLGERARLVSKVTPHAIRHSFATHLLNRGADLFTLMHLLGHSNIQATVRYLRLATVRLAKVYRKCHPRK